MLNLLYNILEAYKLIPKLSRGGIAPILKFFWIAGEYRIPVAYRLYSGSGLWRGGADDGSDEGGKGDKNRCKPAELSPCCISLCSGRQSFVRCTWCFNLVDTWSQICGCLAGSMDKKGYHEIKVWGGYWHKD